MSRDNQGTGLDVLGWYTEHLSSSEMWRDGIINKLPLNCVEIQDSWNILLVKDKILERKTWSGNKWYHVLFLSLG